MFSCFVCRRTHGHPVGHYESASTRKFAFGRTDTIRSCLPEIAGFAFSLLDPSKSPKEKYTALRAAIQAHKDYVQAVKKIRFSIVAKTFMSCDSNPIGCRWSRYRSSLVGYETFGH